MVGLAELGGLYGVSRAVPPLRTTVGTFAALYPGLAGIGHTARLSSSSRPARLALTARAGLQESQQRLLRLTGLQRRTGIGPSQPPVQSADPG